MICIAGKNEIAVFALQWLLKKGVPVTDIVACVNKTDSGKHGWQPSYKKICERLGVRIVSLDELYSIDNLLFISLEYDRLIKPEKFSTNRLFNIHFSNLPAYKGMYTSIWPLVNAEIKAGVTLHYIDRGIDTGDIIDQIVFDIPLHFNGLDLYKNYLRHSTLLFEKNIEALLN
jgi:methionyl-tRNA formyltransferase